MIETDDACCCLRGRPEGDYQLSSVSNHEWAPYLWQQDGIKFIAQQPHDAQNLLHSAQEWL